MKHNKLNSIIHFIKKLIKRKKKYILIFMIGFMIGGICLSSLINIIIHIKSPITVSMIIFISIIINFTIIYLFIKYQKIIDLNDTLEKLEKEQEIKTALFHLNHEIKNPLAVINGYISMIEKTDNESKKKQYWSIIKEELKRSINIINDFSVLGKIKEIEKEPLDLSLIIDDVKEIFAPLLRRNNSSINYNGEDELYIIGDYDRLKQVFINLIKNAIESKDKDFLIIDIKVKKQNKNYKVSIIDNGTGMSREVLTHIEDTFYSTKQNGTGIGVTYVKKIIDLHKGKIYFKSKEKKGTTVTVILPSMN